MGKQVPLRGHHTIEQQPHDLQSLDRQRYDIGRHLGGLATAFAHFELQLLNHFRRDDPQSTLKIELIWSCQTQLTGTYTSE
ncbi:hypothetical protein D3C81_2081250 [compost metagenome]